MGDKRNRKRSMISKGVACILITAMLMTMCVGTTYASEEVNAGSEESTEIIPQENTQKELAEPVEKNQDEEQATDKKENIQSENQTGESKDSPAEAFLKKSNVSKSQELKQTHQARAGILGETSEVDYTKEQSKGVVYDRYEKDESGVYKFYYVINEDAGENIVIDLSKCALEMWENDTQMPGDHYKFRIIIQNKSGKTYRYKDNSFVLAPGDTSNFGSMEDGSMLPVLTYDGQYMPIKLAGAMLPFYFYEDIFEVNSSAAITFEMMCQIYDYLEKAGYTGDTAITDYMLQYYNEKRNVNYTSLKQLFADHPDWVDGELVTSNGIWTMTEEQLQEYIQQYPWIADCSRSVTGNPMNCRS
jgi:hypothetical protein